MADKLTRRQFVAGTAAAAGVVSTQIYAPTIIRAAAPQVGDLVGRLTFDGEAPERAKLPVTKDIECCGKFDIRDERLMVGEKGGLGNVYVYVRSRGVDISPAAKEAVEDQVKLDNKDCIFLPHCMTIWVEEQEFHVVNSDPVAQNVAFHALADVQANEVIPVDGDATFKFNRAQRVPVPIKCNYHPWESAYILPLDHPYAAVTAADGTFRIPNLPAGELEFQFWHEKIGYLSTDAWEKGRLKMTVKPGVNDLGTVAIDPKVLEKD